MNLKLVRNRADLYGVFGELHGEDGSLIAVTLEHSYPEGTSSFGPKMPVGTYTCKRGTHELKAGIPFETFQIMNVPGHTGVLIHKGNYNDDSEGCVLLGSSLGVGCILDSKDAFDKFMTLLTGLDEFTLSVS